ncbi:hypothetical protein [Metallibacterium sp.]|jgi:hypothetical protein|nr:hypothetical protein [Metallibacterium sp.]
MTEQIENLILEMLKGLRNEVQTLRSEVRAEFQDVKQRLTSLERGQAKGHADYAELYGDHARQQAAIDRLSE